MDLVTQSTCSARDYEYVALAETLDVTLVTHDQQVLRDFSDRASSPEDFLTGG